MANTSPFGPFAPGFDFLQGLVSQAGAALPGIGQWVAPTLDPQELEKRINELRTVQFWLEQNARMIAGTIQALEVQKLTLSTLKTMNVQMDDLRDSLQVKPLTTGSPAASPSPQPSSEQAKEASAPPPGVDPLQWWNSLTQQFTQLATEAMQKGAEDVSKHMSAGLQAAASTASASSDGASASNGPDKVGSKSGRKPLAKAATKSTRPRS